jgi:hypothetical protein
LRSPKKKRRIKKNTKKQTNSKYPPRPRLSRTMPNLWQEKTITKFKKEATVKNFKTVFFPHLLHLVRIQVIIKESNGAQPIRGNTIKN